MKKEWFSEPIKFANKCWVAAVSAISSKKQETDIKKLPADSKGLSAKVLIKYQSPKVNRVTLYKAMCANNSIPSNLLFIKSYNYSSSLKASVLFNRSHGLVMLRDSSKEESKKRILQLENSVQHVKDRPENEAVCCDLPESVSAPVSFFRSVSSFFTPKPNVNKAKLVAQAFDNYTSLVEQMKLESDAWLEEVMNKLNHSYDPDDLNFIHDLAAELLNYPELPDDVSQLDEIERITEARIAHHAKIKTGITGYLSRSYANAAVQAQSTTMEM